MKNGSLQQQIIDAFGSDAGWQWHTVSKDTGVLLLPNSEIRLLAELLDNDKTIVQVYTKHKNMEAAFPSSVVKIAMAGAVHYLLSNPAAYHDLFLSEHKWLRALTHTQIARLKSATILPLPDPTPASKEFAGHLNRVPGCKELGTWHSASVKDRGTTHNAAAYVVLNREERICLRLTRSYWPATGKCEVNYSACLGVPEGLEPYCTVYHTEGTWALDAVPYAQLVSDAMKAIMQREELLMHIPRPVGPFDCLYRQALFDMATRYHNAISGWKQARVTADEKVGLCEARAEYWKQHLTALETK